MTKQRNAWFVFLPVFACSFNARGCEPIIPLCALLSGSSAAGPVFVAHSLVWLIVAVVIKCGAFAVFDRRLTWDRAALYMLVGNVISTIPGVLVAVFTASVGGVILAVPLVFVLGSMVGRRVLLLPGGESHGWINGAGAALGFMGFFVVSLAMFGFAGNALIGGNFAAYWVWKFLFVALAAGTGMLISAVLEESVIARLARKTRGNESFYIPVFRANYVTLGVVLFVVALEMLPRRLNAPHFIVSWLRSLPGMLGLA